MKKFFVMVLVIAIVVFAGWAYMNSGNPAGQADPTPTPTPTPASIPTAEPEPEVVTPSPTPEEKEEKLTADAVYSGREDSNSIEIIIDGKYISAKLSSQLKQDFDGLGIEEQDKIKIEYTLKNGLYEVHKISKN